MEILRPFSNLKALSGILLRCMAAGLSGVMLFAAFPPLEWAPIAWMALVPMLIICASTSPTQSFKLGWLCGCVFWLISIAWITRVTVIGWVAISIYSAFYLACFSFAASWWIHRRGVRSRIGNPVLLFAIPALWTGFEFLRSIFASGFPWNPLGVSQFNNLALIQIAEWGGVYSVSYMVALVNTAIALTLIQYWRAKSSLQHRPHPELILSLAVLAMTFWYGNDTMRRFQSSSGSIKVAAIQPNIPQTEKWSEEWFDHIYARLRSTTMDAIEHSSPDLVVWPETAVPDFVRYRGSALNMVEDILKEKVPLLVGSMDYEIVGTDTNYYNTSFLYQPEHRYPQFYHKQHLVLFGEFIPFENIIPFIQSLTPVEGSLTAGTESTIFKLGASKHAFSVLICFEDTIARIARIAVLNGARLLINQTNDAWFDPSSQSRQHMAHGVFRSVENRVATVRATNTGMTCFIDRNGNIYGAADIIKPNADDPTYSTEAVFIPETDMSLTFYTRYGDIFAITCLAITLLIFIVGIWEVRKRFSEQTDDEF